MLPFIRLIARRLKEPSSCYSTAGADLEEVGSERIRWHGNDKTLFTKKNVNLNELTDCIIIQTKSF